MNLVIVGNGILGLMTAYTIIKRDPSIKIKIIGPDDHTGCASLAAAAMFNSFCEIDKGTLKNQKEKEKFLFNKEATSFWPALITQLQSESDIKLEYGFGTYLINNHATDELEDMNFDAIVAALKIYEESYEMVSPKEIPQLNSSAKGRASRAVFIKNEGWINPVILISAIKGILLSSGRVQFINDRCNRLNVQNDRLSSVELENTETKIEGDIYFLAPGAVFSEILKNSDLKMNIPRVFYGVGCSLLIRTNEGTLSNCIRTPNRGLACGIYAAPQDQHHTLIGASNFISPWPEDYARLTSISTILEAAIDQINVNFYRSQLVKVNVGWRPTSADTVPIIGATSISNLLVATGTKRDGLHCSPLIGNYIADKILDKKTVKIDMAMFKPERDLVRILSREEAIDTAVEHTINAAYQHGFVPSKNRILEDLNSFYRNELNGLHDKVGAVNWGIPPEMINMYKYGHI